MAEDARELLPLETQEVLAMQQTVHDLASKHSMFRKVRFIGADGSMGLRHGKRYWARVYRKGGFIWVQWFENLLCFNSCPYGSAEKVVENWSLR